MIEIYQKGAAFLKSNLPTISLTRFLYVIWRLLTSVPAKFTKKLQKSLTGRLLQVNLAAAKENYQRASDGLLKAHTQKALPEISRKLLQEVQEEINALEKKMS